MDPWLLEWLAAHSVELPLAHGGPQKTLDLLTEGSEMASSRWVPSQANSTQ